MILAFSKPKYQFGKTKLCRYANYKVCPVFFVLVIRYMMQIPKKIYIDFFIKP